MMSGHKPRFTLFFALPLLLLLNSQIALSQNGDKQNSLTDGALALQFQIANNFTLTSFQGAILSVKKHLSPGEALRLGVSGSFGFTDNTTLTDITQADTAFGGSSGSGSGKTQSVTVNLQYLYYPNPGAEINVFVGVGPLVGYSHSVTDGEAITIAQNTTSVRTVSDSHSNSWALGVSGLMGVEWFFTKSLSLHAEYGASLQHNWTESTTGQTVTSSTAPLHRTGTTSRTKGWQFNASSIKFGLSVYI